MKLDHVNLTVGNVLALFKKYFGYTDMFEDNNAGMAVLTDGSDMHINLMKGSSASYPKFFHIGFDLETETNVTAMFERLTDDGLQLEQPKHAWGSWTFHFTCPGGDFFIEVACASEATEDQTLSW
jgi:lactoylglutathione lyase